MNLSTGIWLVDTIRRHHRITRREIDRLWSLSPHSNGESGIPRRTFARYIQEVERIFGLTIECDPSTHEYFIPEDEDSMGSEATEWLLNSVALSGIASDLRQASGRVFLEDVPSAREHLATVIKALVSHHVLQFDYHPYTRSRASKGVLLQPYFLKIFRQRWYVTGLNHTDGLVKTYALDRMSSAAITNTEFTIPETFNLQEYVQGSFGIIYDQSPVRDIQLKVTPRVAKYLRDLPLHHSQQELQHDGYSVFCYRLRLTRDFVQEILSWGSDIQVIAPHELRVMVTEELKKTLSLYDPT